MSWTARFGPRPGRRWTRAFGLSHSGRRRLALDRHEVCLTAFSSFRLWNASRATYARLLIPAFLREVRFCVYSDCDVLFLKDPRAMVDQLRASGKMIAGHRNPLNDVDFRWLDAVGEPYAKDAYFCAGLVAMDLDQFEA